MCFTSRMPPERWSDPELCDVCHKPLEEGEEHRFHETRCPNFRRVGETIPCGCYLVAHLACCAECNEN